MLKRGLRFGVLHDGHPMHPKICFRRLPIGLNRTSQHLAGAWPEHVLSPKKRIAEPWPDKSFFAPGQVTFMDPTALLFARSVSFGPGPWRFASWAGTP